MIPRAFHPAARKFAREQVIFTNEFGAPDGRGLWGVGFRAEGFRGWSLRVLGVWGFGVLGIELCGLGTLRET